MSRRLVLGVAGHVDHGKTALVRALTGMETDRLPEERARGISIALGFAHMTVDGAEVDLIDMPGHERFVRTAVSGATGMDAVLLVVDAREGVMPQTREHVDIAALLGVRRAIVAVSRIDLADAPQIAATARAVTALVAASRLQAGAALPVSARTGTGLDALRAAMAAETELVCQPSDDGFAYLPVDRAFSRPGHGTVVTGTLRRGTLAVGDPVEIVPHGATARIRGLQVHGAQVASAQPGQRVAVNVRGVEPAAVARGTALAVPGALPPSVWLSVQIRAVADAPVLATTQPLHLLFGTEEVEARLRLLNRDTLEPGQTALAQFRCAIPVAVPAREFFVVRTLSPVRTVAGGRVLVPQTLRERRHAPAVLARLDALAGADPAGIVANEITRAGIAGVSLEQLARISGLSPVRAATLLPPEALLIREGDVVGQPALQALAAVLPRLLAAHPDGVARETLQTLIPRAGRAVLDEALAQLLASGILARDGASFRVRHAARDRDAADKTERQAAQLAATLREAGLTPPDLAEIAPDFSRRRLVDRLVREGVIIRAPDRVQKRELFFHRDTIESARQQLTGMLGGEGLLVGEIGAALGISRKFSVPLLEYLDSVKFTRRIEERRVLAVDVELSTVSNATSLRGRLAEAIQESQETPLP